MLWNTNFESGYVSRFLCKSGIPSLDRAEVLGFQRLNHHALDALDKSRAETPQTAIRFEVEALRQDVAVDLICDNPEPRGQIKSGPPLLDLRHLDRVVVPTWVLCGDREEENLNLPVAPLREKRQRNGTSLAPFGLSSGRLGAPQKWISPEITELW